MCEDKEQMMTVWLLTRYLCRLIYAVCDSNFQCNASHISFPSCTAMTHLLLQINKYVIVLKKDFYILPSTMLNSNLNILRYFYCYFVEVWWQVRSVRLQKQFLAVCVLRIRLVHYRQHRRQLRVFVKDAVFFV